jgi:hypothetical protein
MRESGGINRKFWFQAERQNRKSRSRSSAFRFARLKEKAIAFRVFPSSGIKVATLPAWKVRWKRVWNKGACKRYGAHSGDRR